MMGSADMDLILGIGWETMIRPMHWNVTKNVNLRRIVLHLRIVQMPLWIAISTREGRTQKEMAEQTAYATSCLEVYFIDSKYALKSQNIDSNI